MKKNNIELMWLMRLSIVTVLLFSAVANSSLFTFHSSLLRAQEIAVRVTPVQQVLPPQAGQYVDNPGKFFTVTLTNLTDDEQRLHIGMNIDMLFPTPQSMVVTPTDNRHIPRQPIVVAPRQTKILNPVEMKQLFNHFNLNEIYIRDGMYNDYKRGIFGLLPEGQYKLFLHAYKWDPNLTSVVKLNSQDNGSCQFTVCYTAQPPQFLSPTTTGVFDAVNLLNVAKVDKNMPVFTWTQPTLNCNPQLLTFEYNVKIVRLDGLHFDDAMDNCPVVYQRNRLTSTTLTLPLPYVQQMMQDKTAVYAIQVTATQGNALQQRAGNLNFTLIENDGRSPVMLFRLYDPTEDLGNTTKGGDTPEGTEKTEGTEGGEEGEGMTTLSVEDEGGKEEEGDSLYVFEQPMLIAPKFPGGAARKIYEENDIEVEWRKAWFSKGKGEKQDTVKFEYTLALYKGNSADDYETIIKYKPIFQHKTKELKDTIPWGKFGDKIVQGDYLVLRVTAKSINEKSIRMLPDSLNWKDFALCDHFDEETMGFTCGTNTAEVKNKTPLSAAPKAGTTLKINSWELEVNGDVKQDEKTKALSGTGWIVNWAPTGMKLRVAVKFSKLMVNTDNVVFEGTCQTFPRSEVNNKTEDGSVVTAVDRLFSPWGLDAYWGEGKLSDETKKKIQDKAGDVAKELDFKGYYTTIKTEAKNIWNDVKAGNLADVYFPTEIPDWLKKKLPKDMSVQIASILVSPKGMVMNIVGEFVMPKSDLLKNEILVFGAPRLCVQPDRLLPEDGILALLSNFTIDDPDSQFEFTFKAPADPLQPQDGCFLKWENDEFGGLGIEAAMKIPNLRRVIDGKATDEVPIIDLKAVIEDSWGDWMGKITMDPFEFEDAEGWIFKPGGEIIYDHSYERNDPVMPALKTLPDTYDPARVNPYTKADWNAWQGFYMQEFSVRFPKWECFGKDEDNGFEVNAKNLFIDNSGFTLDVGVDNVLNAKTSKAGGWQFALDSAYVKIVQNNFNDFHLTGRFRIPLFGQREKDDGGNSGGGNSKSNNNEDEDGGLVHFTCDIRHLTDPEEIEYPLYDKEGNKAGTYKRKRYTDKARMAYIFKTTEVKNLTMDCFVADLNLDKVQCYFVVVGEEQADGKTKTNVELSLGGDITIANANSANAKLAEISNNLPLTLKLPGIHFTKMRLANFKRGDVEATERINKYASDLIAKRDSAENVYRSKYITWKTLRESKEIALTEKCYLDWGEWSLSSAAKKIGPFDLNLKEFDINYDEGEKRVVLAIEGEIGLCGNLVHAAAGVEISSKLTYKEITDLSSYSLSDGEIAFKKIAVGCDFSILKIEGSLEAKDQNGDKGYHGTLNFEIKGLFGVDAQGGYFNHKVAEDDNTTMDLIAADAAKDNPDVEFDKEDRNYSWGYFMLQVKSGAGIQIPPVAITRIEGGFFFNCKPSYDEEKKEYKRPEESQYGLIGVSLGLTLTTTAGESTLKGDLDLNIIYDRELNKGNGGFSTILFKGTVTALEGIIKAQVQLLYQNDDTDNFLSLDISLDAGLDTNEALQGTVGKYMQAANKELEALKDKLNTFQGNLSSDVKGFMANSMVGMEDSPLKSDYSEKSKERDKEAEDTDKKAAGKADASKEKGAAIGKVAISLQLKVTWKEKGVKLTDPKWHLYLGEPDEKKRCEFKLIDFHSKIVNVDIGANGYLCIGNELPNNGQLPPIPSEITDFISGGSEVNTNADMSKADRSRKAAAEAMLGSPKGGVMVGARAWGFIDVDLGLFYGYLRAIAGFDMSFIKYDDSKAFCANLHRRMGYNGWYARGQFYAYLAAKFGLRILIPHLIDRKIDLIDAGIGGVFEAGLPSPTWVKGQARVKVKLLGGLIDINKKFEFEAGQYCETFEGNALDDFNLFGDISVGYDSEKEGWDYTYSRGRDGESTKLINPVSIGKVRSAYITTEASLNSQYRLVDPSTQKALEDKSGVDANKLKLQASRTYVFDFDREIHYVDGVKCVKGARLVEIPKEMMDKLHNRFADPYLYGLLGDMTGSKITSYVHESEEIESDSKFSGEQNQKERYFSGLTEFGKEVPVTIRETRGSKYHFNMTLQPDKCYMLMLTANAYEVEDGQRQWCWIVEENDKGKLEGQWTQWQQTKYVYFSTCGNDGVEVKNPRPDAEDLQPYVALAYPSSEGCKLTNTIEDGEEAYLSDLLEPMIALNTNLDGKIYNDEKGYLYWRLETRKVGETQWNLPSQKYTFSNAATGQTGVNHGPLWQTLPAKMQNANNSLIITVGTQFNNIVPEGVALDQPEKLEHNLQLLYQYPIYYQTERVKNYEYSGEVVNLNTDPGSKIWKFYKFLMMKAGIYKDCPFKDATFSNEQQYSAACLFSLVWIGQDEARKTTFFDHLKAHENEKETITQQRDTTICVANLYFKVSPNQSTMNTFVVRGDKYRLEHGDLLPYERAFTGVRPYSAPAYDYAYLQSQTAQGGQSTLDKIKDAYNMAKAKSEMVLGAFDDKEVFQNKTQYRLQDPYMYFAYLSNYVFIGGQKLKPYSFDDIETRHASETLTFSYNGVDVQGSAYISGLDGKLMAIRDSMYMAYNEWVYNNNQLPGYPLPEGQGDDFDRTLSQQDSRVAPYAPSYNPEHPLYPYADGMDYAVRKFVAPYFIAEKLCQELKRIADDLWGRYHDYALSRESENKTNEAVKKFNALHRGEYLTVSCEGFEVKVPYYQFPLIFGDCFGSGTPQRDPTVYDDKVTRSKRTFAFSLDGDLHGSDRFDAWASCLLFQRLRGGFAFSAASEDAYANNYKKTVFKDNLTGKTYDHYWVNQDVFDARQALSHVRQLQMIAYRVNRFDYANNLYWMSPTGPSGKWAVANLLEDKDSWGKADPTQYLWWHSSEVKVGSSVPDLDSKNKEKK